MNKKYSDFNIGDAVVRKWNNRVYYIIADVDIEKWEYMISEDKDAKFKDCKVCEYYGNLRTASPLEVECGYGLWNFNLSEGV